MSDKPNVLIFSLYYYPFVGGAEVAIREICKKNSDFSYTLITTLNNWQLPREELIDGVRVMRLGLGVRGLDKWIITLPAFWKAWRLHRACQFNLIWSVMINPTAITALLLKWWRPKIKLVLTLQEGDSEEEHRRWTWFWRPLYRQVYQQADAIVVISEYLRKRVLAVGYQGPVFLIPNGVDLEKFDYGKNNY